jgi:hypothetical protein
VGGKAGGGAQIPVHEIRKQLPKGIDASIPQIKAFSNITTNQEFQKGRRMILLIESETPIGA